MKLIKKNNTAGTINDAFKVGDKVSWNVSIFDGRVTEFKKHTGTVVKVNKKTVDVETANGNVFRMNAFIKISTGKWALA